MFEINKSLDKSSVCLNKLQFQGSCTERRDIKTSTGHQKLEASFPLSGGTINLFFNLFFNISELVHFVF